MKLCIVGNGTITHPQGHIINTMDTVIRLSTYKIIGYEHMVGTKTDIVSVARIENVSPDVKIWLGNIYGFGSIPIEIIKKAFPQGYFLPDVEMTQKIYAKYNTHPSLGSLTIWLAVMTGQFFYDKIYVTGFDFGHIGRPKYYYDPEILKGPVIGHDCANERMVLKTMIASGLVEFLDPRDIILLEEGWSIQTP